MKKVYYLSTCSTCRRILREVEPDSEFELQDIKVESITSEQLDDIYNLAGSYSSIFNRQSRKYRELGLHSVELSEDRMRELILEEYTFLKRPVFIFDDKIFIGNSRKVVNELNNCMLVHKRQLVSQDY